MSDHPCLRLVLIVLAAMAIFVGCAEPSPVLVQPTKAPIVAPSPTAILPTNAPMVAPSPTNALPTSIPRLPAAATTAPAHTPTSMAVNQEEPTTAADLSATEQQYTFPVKAKTVNYGRIHHDYPAADIFCAVGSEFVAPTDGQIDYVSREDLWDSQTDRPEDRGGLSVAMIGDDGVRYYGSHLSKIADGIEPGVRVMVGTLLGLTGKSGNARGTPPHLHFGISHPTTPDDWKTRRGEIPPYNYLRAWQRGEQVTPQLKP